MSKPNESIFPKTVRVGGLSETTEGLTRREYFAAMAMQGLISTIQPTAEAVQNSRPMAEDAVTLADALLAELARTEKKPVDRSLADYDRRDCMGAADSARGSNPPGGCL